MKKLAGIVVFMVGLLLFYGVSNVDDFPGWGDPDSPANASPSLSILLLIRSRTPRFQIW